MVDLSKYKGVVSDELLIEMEDFRDEYLELTGHAKREPVDEHYTDEDKRMYVAFREARIHELLKDMADNFLAKVEKEKDKAEAIKKNIDKRMKLVKSGKIKEWIFIKENGLLDFSTTPKTKDKLALIMKLNGYSVRDVCRVFNVSSSTVSVWVNRELQRMKARKEILVNEQKELEAVFCEDDISYESMYKSGLTPSSYTEKLTLIVKSLSK